VAANGLALRSFEVSKTMKDIPWIHTMVGLLLIINASPCFPNTDTQNEEYSYLTFAQDAQSQDLVKDAKKGEAPQKTEQSPVAHAKLTVNIDTNHRHKF
jgi:hypothetical protein